MEAVVGDHLGAPEELVGGEAAHDLRVPAVDRQQRVAIAGRLQVGHRTPVGDLAGLDLVEVGGGDHALRDADALGVAADALARLADARHRGAGRLRGHVGDEQDAVEGARRGRGAPGQAEGPEPDLGVGPLVPVGDREPPVGARRPLVGDYRRDCRQAVVAVHFRRPK